jgi:RNase P subunit RPR2
MFTDDHLEIQIQMMEQQVSFLKELRQRRQEDKFFLPPHEPSKIRKLKKSGQIVSVTCSCGEKTKYKVPLNQIEDFKCPKEGHNGKI